MIMVHCIIYIEGEEERGRERERKNRNDLLSLYPYVEHRDDVVH